MGIAAVRGGALPPAPGRAIVARRGVDESWKGGAMAGMRVVAAACAVLAAAPAAGQGDCGDLGDCLRPLADKVANLLSREAQDRGERLEVSFRPARTEPSGVDIYCRALSLGLRNALHEGVQEERRDAGMNFELLTPDFMRVEPPEVLMVWTPDRTGGGVEILDVEVTVVLADRGERAHSGKVPMSALSRAERGCLFSFRSQAARIAAPEAGELYSEPSYRADAFEADYEKGDTLRMLGCATAAGGVWPVVRWRNPDTRERRDLFAPDLVDKCGPVVIVDDEDDRAFESARRANTVAAFDGYLSSFPSGRHVAEAQRLRDELKDPPPPPGTVIHDCDHCPEMVVVPAGRFEMGSPPSESGRDGDEGPQHEVAFDSPFAVGVYEVTFDEWDACVSNGGCGGYRPADQGWGRGGRPVINVSWDDAQAYASWLSRETGEEYRLLSEAEWEYVARAGTVTRYWWGDGIGANRANCSGDGCGEGYANTAPVGSFGANPFGLHDVHGNVWEWVEDCWHENYARAPSNGDAWLGGQGGDCSRRVLRGGSWYNPPKNLRTALRDRYDTG